MENICKNVGLCSTELEKNNSDLKKDFLIKNIVLYNTIVQCIVQSIEKSKEKIGTFGTGYPFYALNKDFKGNLPLIEEQIRYNNELIKAAENFDVWPCATCLYQNGDQMPDLKQICKPCPNVDNILKPRKVINRLLDIDMWMVVSDENIEYAKAKLIELFNKHNIHSSDTNPIRTIYDMFEIVEYLNLGLMPTKNLPIDAHIINYETLYSLISQMPYTLTKATEEGKIPYLPIHPLSYRKTWQYDDNAYNFVHDYLSSFTEFNFNDELRDKLQETRYIIANNFTFDQLYYYLLETGGDSVKRRHETQVLKRVFKERIDSWKRK